tara:strand:+ start:20605 stop:21639 length:1035 start_codon:yes stop_codon:yes gene_type:complete
MISLREFSLTLNKPFSTSFGTIKSRTGFLVKFSQSKAGFGESTPLHGWTESLASCRGALLSAKKEALLGTPPEIILKSLDNVPSARHGVSLSILDDLSYSQGIPLYKYLGAKHVDYVPVNVAIGDSSITSTVNQCLTAINSGVNSLKIKIGKRPIKEDLRRLTAVRESVGPDVELRADVNGSWSLQQAQKAIKTLEKINLAYLEQPLPMNDLEGHAILRNNSIKIALDESLISNSITKIHEMGAADYIVLKPMVLGGIDNSYTLAQEARSVNIEPVITTTIDTVVARTAAVHLAASLSPIEACGVATAGMLKTDVSDDPTTLKSGNLMVPQTPGNGVLVDWESV